MAGKPRSKDNPHRRIVVIHSLDHAGRALAAAAAAGVAVRLRSAPNAAAYAGATWFQEVVRLARQQHPDADAEASLDCGDAAGLAMGALRQDIELVRFTGRKAVRDKIATMAAAGGGALDAARGKVLDLGAVADADMDAALADFFGANVR